MEYRTKIDFSSNRQIKQFPETITVLSGGTSFGIPFSSLTTGPDLTTTGVTSTINGVVSTFSGNSGTTVYAWYTSSMSLGQSNLSAWTPSNSAITQNTGVVFTASSTTTIDGNTVATSYSGISFDIIPISLIELGVNSYSGTVYTNSLNFYSASTLDFTGRTIWVDVSGITRTERLILTNVGSGPGLIDIGVDANGFVVNQASDINLKTNINTITNALDKVLKLRGVTYNWINTNSGGDKLKMGLIAQEVNEIIPELAYCGPNGLMGVHYKDIPALLIEAIKELVNNKQILTNDVLSTQTISAEDNNIELNFNGSHVTAIGGGLIVCDGVDDDVNAELVIDDNGNWVTNNSLKPKSLIIPEYTPTSADDINGNIGDITRDNNFLYIKGINKWKKINLENL
jgi:hypothetical protein